MYNVGYVQYNGLTSSKQGVANTFIYRFPAGGKTTTNKPSFLNESENLHFKFPPLSILTEKDAFVLEDIRFCRYIERLLLSNERASTQTLGVQIMREKA